MESRQPQQHNRVPSPASDGSALTAFQRKILDYVSKGYGPSAAPREYTAQQRRELADLLSRGLVRISKNHSRDKHGAYSAPNSVLNKPSSHK